VQVAWGVLPLGLPLAIVLVLGLGALTLPRADGLERLLAGGLLTTALTVVTVALLGALGVLTTPVLAATLVVSAVAVVLAIRARQAPWRLNWRLAVSREAAPLLLVAAVALGLVVSAAYYLPVWQWDALAYHLPYVDFVLQNGTFADVPADVPYLSTYPHVVEWAYTAWRAMLPDDRLVDLAQLPFGLLGAVAIATTAHHQGARPDHAVAAGAVWLTLPAVFLQLPTNYIDGASAAVLLTAVAFLLSPLDRTRVVLAAIAIGLYLGTKPQAPVGAAILLAVLTVLAVRAGLGAMVPIAWTAVAAFGAQSYVVNVVHHDNPIWPVHVDLGPLHLPGPIAMADLLDAGEPRQGNVLTRLVESWSTIFPPERVFDMRIGGLGLIFLIALPFAVVRLVRIRSPVAALCFVATLATPEPSVARYVLGFAGLTLAFAMPVIEHPRVRGWMRSGVFGALALAGAGNLLIAYPGLAGPGPELADYVSMTQEQRQSAVGAAGAAASYRDAIAHVGEGRVTVFDASYEFPYLAWPFDLSRKAVFVPIDADYATAERIVLAPNVEMLIVGDDTIAGSVVRNHPEQFVPQFHSMAGWTPCTIYLRR
jgi:hypothetical protein